MNNMGYSLIGLGYLGNSSRFREYRCRDFFFHGRFTSFHFSLLCLPSYVSSSCLRTSLTVFMFICWEQNSLHEFHIFNSHAYRMELNFFLKRDGPCFGRSFG